MFRLELLKFSAPRFPDLQKKIPIQNYITNSCKCTNVTIGHVTKNEWIRITRLKQPLDRNATLAFFAFHELFCTFCKLGALSFSVAAAAAAAAAAEAGKQWHAQTSPTKSKKPCLYNIRDFRKH